MKRIVSVLLCCVLLMTSSVLCMGVSAASSNSVTFTVTANDAKVGETVNVVVSISENSYFTNATVYLHYDSAVMEYVSDALGEAAPKSAMYMSNNFADRDYVKMAYVAINGLQKGGELWVFEFKALSEAATEFTVSFDECIGAEDDNDDFELNYTVVPCSVNNKGQTTTKATTTKTTTTVKNDDTVTTTVSDETTTADGTTTTAEDGKITTTTKEATDASTTTAKANKTTTTTKAVSDEDTPKTGDDSLALLAIVIGVAALAVVGATVMMKKIRN